MKVVVVSGRKEVDMMEDQGWQHGEIRNSRRRLLRRELREAGSPSASQIREVSEQPSPESPMQEIETQMLARQDVLFGTLARGLVRVPPSFVDGFMSLHES